VELARAEDLLRRLHDPLFFVLVHV
jgi:hypothetical protein